MFVLIDKFLCLRTFILTAVLFARIDEIGYDGGCLSCSVFSYTPTADSVLR